MRIKVVVALSVLAGALSVFGGAAPAHACQTELPDATCIQRDVCLVTGGKLVPFC